MTMDLIPTFPTQLGEEHGVEFAKNREMYRIVRAGEMTWVVHRRHTSASQFELVLSGTDPVFDVAGRNGLVQVHAMGASVATIFTKLF
jgi:hypothetical protein